MHPSATPAPAVLDALLTTLDDEVAALDRLAVCAEEELRALRFGPEALEAAGLATAEAVSALESAGVARSRRQHLLARTLHMSESARLGDLADCLPAPDADRLRASRDRVREAARTADARTDSLAFALDYAASLGRETLAAWQGLHADRPAQAYAPPGRAAQPKPGRSLFNQTG